MSGIAPCSDRRCCSLQEARRECRAAFRQGPQKSRPMSETHSISPPGLANANVKAWEAINILFFVFVLVKQSWIHFISSSWRCCLPGKGLHFSCCGGKGPQQWEQKKGFLLPAMGSAGSQLLWYALHCSSGSFPVLSHINEPLKQLLGRNQHMSVDEAVSVT